MGTAESTGAGTDAEVHRIDARWRQDHHRYPWPAHRLTCRRTTHVNVVREPGSVSETRAAARTVRG